jgi:acyl-CoA synthetase (AMP-forming)/AMP-acid ligase II
MSGPRLHDWVFRYAAVTPDAPAIATGTSRLAYRDLAERTLALAGALRAQGVGPGSRVVVALPNGPAMVIASLAVQALGGTAVEVDRRWGAGPLRDILIRTKARQVVTWGRDARTWAEALDGVSVDGFWVVHGSRPVETLPGLPRPMAWLSDTGRSLADADALSVGDLPSIDDGVVALILFTSGTTGTPQGVLQTHRNIEANTRSIVSYLGLTGDDRVLATLPLHYCYGRSLLQTHLMVGGSVYFDNRFAFPRTVMETLAAEGCTGFAGVPLTFEILRRSVNLAEIPMPTLRYVTQAGGALSPDTIQWARTAFAPAPLYVMYGQTEATARLTYLPPEHAEDKAGSIGIPVPGVELRVVDETGRDVTPGTLGEIVVRGPNVTPGYLDDPTATAAILRDSWLWTGDLAEMDTDGFLFHRGRAREIIKVGGRRVSPVEIEQAIERLPAVAESGVRGMPDELRGEVPVAFVVLHPGSQLSAGELRAALRAIVPAWMVPATVTFVDRLPRNEAGKLLRANLPLVSAPAVAAPG